MERISPAVTLPIVTTTSDLCSNLFAYAQMILLSVKQWYRAGATENARHENTGRSKMQGWKMRDMNLRHQIAGVENARHENAAPICKGGKCGKS